MKIVITRPEKEGKDLANKLKKVGFEPILFPTIYFKPVEFEIKNLQSFDIFIFTSPRTVKFFFQKIKPDLIRNKELITVGKKTKKTLENLGFTKIKYPEIQNSEGLLKLLESDSSFRLKKILFPKSEIAQRILENRFKNIHSVIVYKTLVNHNHKDIEFCKQFFIGSIKAVIFTSPSTVYGFYKNFGIFWKYFLIKPKIVAIGKTTKEYLEKAGFENIYQPENPSNEAIIDLILRIIPASKTD